MAKRWTESVTCCECKKEERITASYERFGQTSEVPYGSRGWVAEFINDYTYALAWTCKTCWE